MYARTHACAHTHTHTHTHKHTHTHARLLALSLSPAQSLDEVLCTSADLLRELDDINSLEDDVVGSHWVWSGEGGTPRQQLKH